MTNVVEFPGKKPVQEVPKDTPPAQEYWVQDLFNGAMYEAYVNKDHAQALAILEVIGNAMAEGEWLVELSQVQREALSASCDAHHPNHRTQLKRLHKVLYGSDEEG